MTAEPTVHVQEWNPRLRALLALCLVLTLGLGIGKTLFQRAHPPDYASRLGNSYEGWVSIDGHSHRAARVRDWLLGRDPGGRALVENLKVDAHPTALVVPSLVAALALVMGSIPVSFLALSMAAVVLNVLLTARLARFSSGSDDPVVPRLAALLVCGHVYTIRTSAQLQLDLFVPVVAILSVLTSLRFAARPGPRSAALVVLVQTTGMFTKTTFMPMLAAPALIAIVTSWRGRAALRAPLVAGIRAGFLFGALPLLLWIGSFALIADVRSATREFVQYDGYTLTTRRFWEFLLEMVLFLQLLPLLLWSRRRTLNRAELAVGAVLALALLLVWSARLPGVPRYYLHALSFLVALAAPALASLPSRRVAVAALAGYLIVNYLAAIVILVLQVVRVE